MDRQSLIASQNGLSKSPETDAQGGAPALLALLNAIGTKPRQGASILDFGCGIGQGVRVLTRMGFDAYGVDIYEFWGADFDQYWGADPVIPTPQESERLKVAQAEPYRLPYPDACFDNIISTQVLEHVADLPAVLAELYRVSKPGGVGVHIFPSRWVPFLEGHTCVPIPLLCKYQPWLKLAAIAGFRYHRHVGMNWRDVYRANVAQMEWTHYPPRSTILAQARSAGFETRFAESEYVRRSGTGWTRLYNRLGPLALLASKFALQNMLVLKR